MAAVIVARRRHCNAQRAQERVFRRRISLFDLSDNDIVRRYRLPGHAIIALLDEIKDDIEPITQRSHAVPGIVKLLSTLQVLASGSFQTPIAGDSGYQLQPWIVTPVRNPVTEGEAAYNRAHIRTRGIIERIFGILKSCFRCLDRSGGALLYSPCKVCKVVVVCCILHNIAIRAGVRLGEQEAEAEGEGDFDSNEEEPNAPLGEVRPERGRDVRLNIIRNYFE
ncbi:hypothetical protein SKAU_G00247450 [Synaphobranchus kaupii]|uniref:DDE Tnp4 domain-containing protein n=1 Tax=Synaphobranchus kaupii TaxID=118154 RepID=A0A9Q1F2F9_SYNKA|nr:hypothetical protein SKAU_G00247450 [Synaphobranchus kaupii]